MKTAPVLVPRKETIYDGPETDLFKARQRKDASLPVAGKETVHEGEVPEFISRRFSAAEVAEAAKPRTETVHEGEIPEFITRRFSAAQVSEAMKPQTETVHHGPIPEMFSKLGRIAQDLVMPDRETIYSGPDVKVKRVTDVSYRDAQGSVAGADSDAKKETVFDEATFKAKRIDTSASRSLVTRLVQRASVRFFAVAALSLIELYLCRNNLPVAISSGIMFVAFSVVGFYTFKMNLKALLFAIGLYACSTLFMGVNAVMHDNVFLVIVPLFSRGFMIYNLLRTYGLLVDLHLLEAEIY
jgi:hypothetical protein